MMPTYTFRVITGSGSSEMDLGFHKDEAAVTYGRRMAAAARVEVWRSVDRISTIEPQEVGHVAPA